MTSNCYKLSPNPVFELRKNYINQDETELLLCYRLLYILCLASCLLPSSSSCVLLSALCHQSVMKRGEFVTIHQRNTSNWHQLWIHTVKQEPGRLIHEAYTMRCTAKPGFTFRENHRITIECVNPGECWNGLTHSLHQIIIHISTIPFQQNELAYYWRLITGLWRVVWVVYCLKWANSGIATVLIL